MGSKKKEYLPHFIYFFIFRNKFGSLVFLFFLFLFFCVWNTFILVIVVSLPLFLYFYTVNIKNVLISLSLSLSFWLRLQIFDLTWASVGKQKYKCDGVNQTFKILWKPKKKENPNQIQRQT